MPIRPLLAAAAALNLGGAIVFLPSSHRLRALAGLPEAGHELFYWTMAIWVAVFGAACLAQAITGRVDRTLVAVVAVAKLAFAVVVAVLCLDGRLPPRAALAAAGDFALGTAMVAWLFRPFARR
jgi:hypothetical protein